MNPDINMTSYYYIDESGGIETKSSFFILGCYKTDTPEHIYEKIELLKNELLDSPYFAFERQKIIQNGFHATDNHFDVRARFYELISKLNIRAYILILKKDSDFFKSLLEKKLSSTDIYMLCIKKLLSDRLTKTRNHQNIVIFEQYGNKVHAWANNLEKVLEDIKIEILKTFNVELKFEIQVHDKSDTNLAVIDYINFLFTQFYEHNKMDPRMIQNFKIIEPKLGLIYKFDRDIFYHKNKRLEVSKY